MASDDEERRKLLKPDPTEEQVLAALRSSYCAPEDEDGWQEGQGGGAVIIVKELESYDDRNYLVEVGGVRYLAKVHNGVESEAYLKAREERRRRRRRRRGEGGGGEGEGEGEGGGKDNDDDGGSRPDPPTSVIDLQNAVFSRLSDPKHGVTTSKPVPVRNPSKDDGGDNGDGDGGGGGQDEPSPPAIAIHSLPVSSPSHSPRPLAVRLLSWVEGRPMSSVPRLPVESLAAAGRYLGLLRRALDDLGTSDPDAVRAATRYHAWDGRNTSDLCRFVECIEGEERRELVRSVLVAFRETFGGEDGGAARDFPRGILMGDYNDANVIVDDELRVAGVIDFGDSTYSWRVLDVSVAMAYAMISSYGKSGRSLSAAAALLRGVHSVYPLSPSERRHLRLLVACRLACSVLLGAYSYKQNPGNEYLLFHAEPAWRTLELVWGRCRGEEGEQGRRMAGAIDGLFEAACAGVGGGKGEGGRDKDEDAVVDCSDLALPDPDVPDLLAAVRAAAPTTASTSTSTSSSAAAPAAVAAEGGSDAVAPPPAKRRKTDDKDDDDEEGGRPVVTFVTGNRKKLEEVARILGAADSDGDNAGDGPSSSSSPRRRLPFDVTNRKLDLPELQGSDPDEIAREKCALAANEVDGPVITEDTSLCFSALKDLPGPYIKWFLDKLGHDGLNDMISFSDNKSAYALTVVAFCPGPGMDVRVFRGRTDGKVVRPRGDPHFGWDPVFEPSEGQQEAEKKKKTYAEMSAVEKDAVSHRSRAFKRLREYLLEEERAIRADILSKEGGTGARRMGQSNE